MNIYKLILVFLGTISLGLGFAGIFIPGLPTTPFLLLTAGLYVRSSDRLYHWLISNQYVGSYIREYQSKKGMSLRAKLCSITLMWSMILISSVFFIPQVQVKIIVLILGIAGTIVMGFIVPTISK